MFLVTAFPTKQQFSLVVPIELGTHLNQPLDGGGAATCQSVNGSSSGKAARNGESVFGMCAGRVVGGKGSRNTSLGPPRRARIGRRDHIRPIETQRNREAGDACPNDQRGVEP